MKGETLLNVDLLSRMNILITAALFSILLFHVIYVHGARFNEWQYVEK